MRGWCQEFLGFSTARTMTVRALRFTEVSTLNPVDIEPVLDIHIGLRRRLHRYGKLKKDLEKMAQSRDTAVDELAIEEMKQRIESQFNDTEESELRGASLCNAYPGPLDIATAELTEPVSFHDICRHLG